MKRIENKIFLLEMLLKTNLVIEALHTVYDIKKAITISTQSLPNFTPNISYDLIVPVYTEVTDSSRLLDKKSINEIKYLYKLVSEVRHYIYLHLYENNIAELESYTTADIDFVKRKINYLNEAFKDYKQMILEDTSYPFDVSIKKYYRELL